VFFIGLAGICVIGMVWWLRWQARDHLQRQHLAVLALMLQGKKPLSTEAVVVPGRKVPVTTQPIKKMAHNPFEADCVLLDEDGIWSVLPAN